MSPEPKKLDRSLGLLSVFSIASGAMISSGLFVLPGIAYEKAGAGMVISYAIAAFLTIPALLSKAEFATAMPKTGGSYFFIERSLGPLLGTIAGLSNWLSIALKSAFALVGIGALATLVFPNAGDLSIKFIAIAACIVFTIINIGSVKETGRLQSIVVLVLIGSILAYCVAGVRAVDFNRIHNIQRPFLGMGWNSVFAVAGLVFISFGGLTKVVSVAEEVRSPARNIPLGMILALGVVGGLHVVAAFAIVGTVDSGALSGSLTPMSASASATLGRTGAVLIDLAALFAFVTTANAGILAASRTPMAMAIDGLIPAYFAATNQRFKSPHRAIIATALFMILTIAFLSLEDLVKTASTMLILMFILQEIAVIVMTFSRVGNYRPTFKAPLFPYLQFSAIVIYSCLIVEMGTLPLLLTGAFALTATLWFVLYVNRRIDRESAFVYLVKRIVSKEISPRGLENELKQITLERDDVAFDRFDQLVDRADILDIPGPISVHDLFQKAAESLAGKLAIDKDELYRRLVERERESTTIVHPGLAVPHIVIEGENVFELLLVRCKGGAVFSDLHPPIETAFILAGSKDERNFHLRALMTIAHIVENEDFQTRWSEAAGPDELRDIVHLSNRKRK